MDTVVSRVDIDAPEVVDMKSSEHVIKETSFLTLSSYASSSSSSKSSSGAESSKKNPSNGMSNKEDIENNKEVGIKSYAAITNEERIVGSNFPQHDNHSMNQSMNVRKTSEVVIEEQIVDYIPSEKPLVIELDETDSSLNTSDSSALHSKSDSSLSSSSLSIKGMGGGGGGS